MRVSSYSFKEMVGRIDEFVIGHFTVEERSAMLAGPEVADAWASKIHGRMLEHDEALAAKVERFTGSTAKRRRDLLKCYLREERDRLMLEQLQQQVTLPPRRPQATLAF